MDFVREKTYLLCYFLFSFPNEGHTWSFLFSSRASKCRGKTETSLWGCFYFLAIMDNAAMNIGMQISLCELASNHFGYILRSGLLDHIDRLSIPYLKCLGPDVFQGSDFFWILEHLHYNQFGIPIPEIQNAQMSIPFEHHIGAQKVSLHFPVSPVLPK